MAATPLDIPPVGAALGAEIFGELEIVPALPKLDDADPPTGVGPPRWEKHVADANGPSDVYGMSYQF